MRVRQLTPNLIQLTRLRFVNAFLVREDDGFTLVDIGSLEVVEAPGHTPGHVEMVQASRAGPPRALLTPPGRSAPAQAD